MKKYIITLLTIALVLLLGSCNDNDLLIVQKGVIPVDETYANANDQTAGQLIGEVYVEVKNLTTGDWGIHYLATNAVKVADFWPGGSDANDGGDYQQMAKMIDNSENSAYRDMYQRFYKIIYKSNMIVDKLNNGSTERKRVIAEAKAWRAWAMMRLTRLWGSAPLVDHVLDGINYSLLPVILLPKRVGSGSCSNLMKQQPICPRKTGWADNVRSGAAGRPKLVMHLRAKDICGRTITRMLKRNWQR